MPFGFSDYNYLNFKDFIEKACGLINNYRQFFGSLFFFLMGRSMRWAAFA